MARKAIEIKCTPEDVAALKEMEQSSSPKAVQRAKIILMALDGHSNEEIAAEVGLSKATVCIWKKTFRYKGVEGIRPQEQPQQEKEQKPKQKSDPVSSRTRSWNIPTLDTPMLYCFPVAFYVGPAERVMIIANCSQSSGAKWDGRGKFTTRNSAVARELEKKKEDLPLDDAIALAERYIQRRVRVSKDGAAGFLKDLLSRLPKQEGIHYDIITSSSRLLNIVPKNAVFSRSLAQNRKDWMETVRQELPPAVSKELSAELESYLDSCKDSSAPLVWSQKLPETGRSVPASAVSPDAKLELERAYLELLENQGLTARAGEVSYAAIAVTMDADGHAHFVPVSDPSAKQNIYSFDYSSPEGLMHGINELEKGTVTLRNKLGQALFKQTHETVKKKEG